jgi:hypothetical protein
MFYCLFYILVLMFVELVKKLYAEADPDDTGNVSPEVFIDILKKLGVTIANNHQAVEIVAEVDKDNSGEISLDEILFFLMQHFEEVSAKITDLTEFPIMCLKNQAQAAAAAAGQQRGNFTPQAQAQGGTTPTNPNHARNSHTPVPSYPIRYIPPREGILTIELVNGIVKKPICKTLSAFDKNSISKVARDSGNTTEMLTHALVTTKVRLDEALELYDTMFRDTGAHMCLVSSCCVCQSIIVCALDALNLRMCCVCVRVLPVGFLRECVVFVTCVLYV